MTNALKNSFIGKYQMKKDEIRSQMLEKRNLLTFSQQQIYSDRISRIILNSSLYRNCKNLCIYQAFRKEVSCDKIIKQALRDKKQVFVPVTDSVSKTMEFYRVTEMTEWKKGAYGILEPVLTDTTAPLREAALILMPGLVFDKNKHRIGYGGGYYDKYLACHIGHTTIALCYHFQIIDENLPCEEHDILPDYIATDEGIF